MQTTKETETFVPQTCSPEELVSHLESHGQSGLTQRQARYRLRLHGKNLFRKEFALRPAEGIKSQLRGMVSLLFIATMLVLYLFLQDNIYLISMGLGLFTWGVGALWELIAARILGKREKHSALAVQVVRDGKTQKTDSRLLVQVQLGSSLLIVLLFRHVVLLRSIIARSSSGCKPWRREGLPQ